MAERCYAAACGLQPGHAVAQHNWGIALQELGRPGEAISAFERALGARPDYAQAYCALGLAYQSIDAPDAALLAFDCAIRLDARDDHFAIEHARTQLKLGHFVDAQRELEALAQRCPNDAVVFNLLGIALKNLGRAAASKAALDRAIALDPACAEAFSNRANLEFLFRRFSQSLDDYDRALALRPDLDWVLGSRIYTAAHLFDWTARDHGIAELVRGLGAGAKLVQPLALQTLIDDPALHHQAARLWVQSACAPVEPASVAAHAPASGKIRIAYVSKDFRSHPVSFLMAEVIELHDRDRFELIAINYGPRSEDPMQVRLRAAFDVFLDVEDLSDRAIVELARGALIDIAVDLSGFTEGVRSSIFALRAAPVQVSYLGYLGTSGTGLYDYLIADVTLVPPAQRSAYAECIAELPSYQANDRQRPRPGPAGRVDLGLPESSVVYCCFNNPCKITPAVFMLWMDILRAVPGAVLWLLEEDEKAPVHLREHAQRHGIDGSRLVFARRTNREGYLAHLATADIFLDTLPYNAGTTASDALWVGLPVVTQVGRTLAARMAASLLEAAGLPDLITTEAETYKALAIQLGRQPEMLREVKARLDRQRLQCALFDTARFTRNLEDAYRQMQEISLAGAPARDLRVLESLDGDAYGQLA